LIAYFVYFLKFLFIVIFVVIVLVEFSVTLVRNGIFYTKYRSSNSFYHFLLCHRYHAHLLKKKKDKILTHFGDAHYQNHFFFSAARGSELLQWSDLPLVILYGLINKEKLF